MIDAQLPPASNKVYLGAIEQSRKGDEILTVLERLDQICEFSLSIYGTKPDIWFRHAPAEAQYAQATNRVRSKWANCSSMLSGDYTSNNSSHQGHNQIKSVLN